MKLLLVHPGATYSTHDVYVAMREALQRAAWPYAEWRLDGRIERASGFLHYLWRQKRKEARTRAEAGPPWPKPTMGDVLWQATTGLVERALAQECDGILIVSAMLVHPDYLELARRAGLRIYLLLTETPYLHHEERMYAARADGVWSNERTAPHLFGDVCDALAYLPHAYRAGVHDAPAPPPTGPVPDVVFVGSAYPERIALLEGVCWDGMRLALYGDWDAVLVPSSPLRPYVAGGTVPNADALALYQRAAIGLNLYRRHDPAVPVAPESCNPRAYELAAAGACIVSEARPEVADVFGDAVPTFTDSAGLEAQLRALAADPARRQALGAAARAAVQGHTWDSRVEQMRRDLERWRCASRRGIGEDTHG